MCIVPGQPQVLIPPTAKGVFVARYLRLAVICTFIYAVLNFVSMNWIQGVFDLLGALIGLLAVRSREGFAYQQVLCFCMFCSIRFVISVILAGITFSQPDLNAPSVAPWVFWVIVVQYCLGPFVFAAGASLSWSELQPLTPHCSGSSLAAAASDVCATAVGCCLQAAVPGAEEAGGRDDRVTERRGRGRRRLLQRRSGRQLEQRLVLPGAAAQRSGRTLGTARFCSRAVGLQSFRRHGAQARRYLRREEQLLQSSCQPAELLNVHRVVTLCIAAALQTYSVQA